MPSLASRWLFLKILQAVKSPRDLNHPKSSLWFFILLLSEDAVSSELDHNHRWPRTQNKCPTDFLTFFCYRVEPIGHLRFFWPRRGSPRTRKEYSLGSGWKEAYDDFFGQGEDHQGQEKNNLFAPDGKKPTTIFLAKERITKDKKIIISVSYTHLTLPTTPYV